MKPLLLFLLLSTAACHECKETQPQTQRLNIAETVLNPYPNLTGKRYIDFDFVSYDIQKRTVRIRYFIWVDGKIMYWTHDDFGRFSIEIPESEIDRFKEYHTKRANELMPKLVELRHKF